MADRRFNRLAMWSFVLSLLFFTLISAVMGHLSLRQIRKTGERGRGLALAAVLIGWIGTAFLAWLISSPNSLGFFLGWVTNALFAAW